MKWILSLFLAALVCVPSYGSFIFQAPAAGSLNNPNLTGTVTFFTDQMIVQDGTDRTIFRSNVYEFNNYANDRTGVYIVVDNTHPQFTLQGLDHWMEGSGGGGAAGAFACYPGKNCDFGYSTFQQDDLAGFHQFRHMAWSGTVFFVPPSERASYTISSSSGLMQLNRGGTVAGADQGLLLDNASYWKVKNGGQYWEQYMGGSGLNLVQTNQNFNLNYESGHGKLIIGDSNAASDGKRLQTITLSGGTLVKSNDSVTANTVPFCSVLTPSNPGFLSYSVSAGTSYTITSSNASDASVLKCLLVENGR